MQEKTNEISQVLYGSVEILEGCQMLILPYRTYVSRQAVPTLGNLLNLVALGNLIESISSEHFNTD